jgi:hypothetical protein
MMRASIRAAIRRILEDKLGKAGGQLYSTTVCHKVIRGLYVATHLEMVRASPDIDI